MATKNVTKERTRINISEPKKYKVVMHNDDFTTMEFVVEILMDVFHKDEIDAEELMMKVHVKGKATIGQYPYDIATTRVGIALARAKAQGFPFRMTVEET